MPMDYRSRAREVSLTFRMTAERRQLLHAEAIEAGLTVQQLLESRVWGAAEPRRRSGPRPQEDRLELSA